MPTPKEYKSPDFLADVKDIFAMTAESLASVDWEAKGKALFGSGWGHRPIKDAFDQTVEPITEAISGFLRGVSEEQQKNYGLMSEIDPSKGITEEQLGATIAETINIATITKPAAVKQLSQAFKERKSWIAGMFDAAGRIESPKLAQKAKEEAAQLKQNYPIVTKALRQLPQELLDPVKEVGLSVPGGQQGSLNPYTLRADWSVERGINLRKEAVPHELLHGVDIDKLTSGTGLNPNVFPRAFFEARGYEGGKLMAEAMEALPKGGKITKEAYENIMEVAEKNITDRWGKNPFLFEQDKVVRHYVKHKPLDPVEEEAQRAIGKMRGVGVEDLYQLDSLPKEPGFFSKLEETVDEVDFGKKPNAKIDIGQIKGFLQGKGRDVSKTEVENVLGGLEGKVAKDDLLREIAANKTEFKDVVLSGGEEGMPDTMGGTGAPIPNLTKFSQYQEPGAIEGSYRETFVTAPKEGFVKGEYNGDFDNPEIPEKIWGDGHGAYEDIVNPIVRLRHNDRIVDGKKILFIEEMQGPLGDTKWKVDIPGMQVKEPIMGGRYTKVVDQKLFDTKTEAETAAKQFKKPPTVSKVIEGEQGKMPSYLQSRIYDTGVKKALIMAKEGGYDGVAWTTGEMQVKRYEDAVVKSVDKVEWRDFGNGEKNVEFKLKGTQDHIRATVDSKGIVTESKYSDFIGKHINKIIGDKVGPDIINKTNGYVSGLDIKIGGEGLKKVYNKTLPEKFSKFGKEEIRELRLSSEKIDETLDVNDIVSNIKSAADELYTKGERDSGERLADLADYYTSRQLAKSDYIDLLQNGTTEEELSLLLKAVPSIFKKDLSKSVPYLLVTPKTSGRFPTYAVLPPAALALNELMKVLPPRTSSEEY